MFKSMFKDNKGDNSGTTRETTACLKVSVILVIKIFLFIESSQNCKIRT